ncbi:hypothetical protein JTE90_017950 [Oedothorax gibbosus]|uniref:SOCS box domain-containing protein n=1 Tax=Oedothorax gibbosus TaxID=931172 RepID=A0AAV6V9V5_9ARAC|nr:hypothetical protein JTE90_017950 [Oedothorax gibbosus]
MLLRAVKYVDISLLFSFISVRLPNEVLKRKFEHVYEILPMLCIGPQKLQHLCRWGIRKQICDCGQLPDGIYRLPIPKFLQGYLGLKYDESDVTFSKGT